MLMSFGIAALAVLVFGPIFLVGIILVQVWIGWMVDPSFIYKKLL